MKWGQPAPFALIRWEMAERFGWTLEQVDALNMSDLMEFYQVEDGRIKARQHGSKGS